MSLQVLQPKYRTQETLDAIKECLDKKWTGMGYKTVEFEEQCMSIQKSRIRVPNYQKVSVFARSYLKYRLNLL